MGLVVFVLVPAIPSSQDNTPKLRPRQSHTYTLAVPHVALPTPPSAAASTIPHLHTLAIPPVTLRNPPAAATPAIPHQHTTSFVIVAHRGLLKLPAGRQGGKHVAGPGEHSLVPIGLMEEQAHLT